MIFDAIDHVLARVVRAIRFLLGLDAGPWVIFIWPAWLLAAFFGVQLAIAWF